MESSSENSLDRTCRTWYRFAIPYTMTALRVAAIPFFYTFWQHNQYMAAVIIFLLIILSDFLDGYLARQLHVASRAGAYLDATADFLVVLSIFALFVMQGLYARWVVLLIIFMFAQFLVTAAKFLPAMYDPVGKYFGGFLFVVIGITIACPKAAVCAIFSISLLGMALLSLTSRVLTLFDNA